MRCIVIYKDLVSTTLLKGIFIVYKNPMISILLSVHLARRVLKLEKMNTTLQGQLEDEKKKRDELLQEV